MDKEFDGIELRLAVEDAKNYLGELINELQKLDQNQFYKESIQELRQALIPPPFDDERFFIASKPNGNALHADKLACVLCLLKLTFRQYWALCKGDSHKAPILSANINQLKLYAKNGLESYRTIGDLKKGYSLTKI